MLKNLGLGAIIGLANIIPGVSGGTVALILGIYKRLIKDISQFNKKNVLALLKCFSPNPQNRKLGLQSFRDLDGPFLLSLGVGAVLAIVLTSKLITYLLLQFHDQTYGFFAGLVLLSIVVPWRLIRTKSASPWIGGLAGFFIIVAITYSASGPQKVSDAERKFALKSKIENVQQVDKSDFSNPVFYLFAGAVAISAMILPGISGSFLLILLGVYFEILQAIAERNLIVIGSFALGCLLGLILFSKFLNWILDKYHDSTMGFLSGLMLGSLYAIWPFQSYAIVGSKRIDYQPIIPSYDQNLLWTSLLFIAGATLVGCFLKFNRQS
jgi:putative membrane protein